MGELRINPKKTAIWLFAIILCMGLLNVVSYIPMLRGTRTQPILMLNLDSEQNLPSLFSTLLLWIGAVLCGFIAKAGGDTRADRNHWAGLSALFFYLGTDEFASLHERLGGLTDHMLASWGLSTFAWVIPYSFLLIFLLIYYVKFLFRLPVETMKWLIFSGIIYVAGALGCEIVGGIWYLRLGHGPGFIYYTIVAGEELLEMSGCTVFIYTLMTYIDKHVPGFRLRITSS
jgi:hypothetical protein